MDDNNRLAHSEPRLVAGEVREVLEWYAENVSGCRKIGRDGDAFRQALDADGGKRATAALATHSPAPTEAGDVERLRKLLSDLERSATAVYRKGITAGPQWSRLGGDLIRSRAALSSTQGGAEG